MLTEGRSAAIHGIEMLASVDSGSFEVAERQVHLLNQGRQSLPHDDPKDVEIDLIVAVDQSIPRSDDLTPRDSRVLDPDGLRNPASGLTDDLDETRQGECFGLMGFELDSSQRLRDLDGPLRGIPHVPQGNRSLTFAHIRSALRPGLDRGSSG